LVPNPRLQWTRRPRFRSGRSLCSLGSPLTRRPLDGVAIRQSYCGTNMRSRYRLAVSLFRWTVLLVLASSPADLCRAHTLYGIRDLSGQFELFSINPSTGVVTPLIATGAASLVGSSSAFDPVGRRFFFQSDPNLYVVNVAQGTVSHTSLSPQGSFRTLEFDTGGRAEAIPTLSFVFLGVLAAIPAAAAMRFQPR